jgi:hypothetical protein
MRRKGEVSPAHANRVAKSIVRETIDRLKEMTGGRLSGDYSGLASLWEEICVQVQRERSFHWNDYVETINSFLVPAVIALTPDERRALWFETRAGWDWQYDHRGRRWTPPVDVDDIVVYLKDHLLVAAREFQDKNTRRYLNGRAAGAKAGAHAGRGA